MTKTNAATSAPSRNRHIEMLVAATLVFLLAALLDVDHERIFFRAFPNLPIPNTCLSRELFHFECPACGLTRSIVYLVHGQWRNSLHCHRLGWLMAMAIFAQFPYRIACLRFPELPRLGKSFPRLFGLALIVLLIGNWLVGLLVAKL